MQQRTISCPERFTIAILNWGKRSNLIKMHFSPFLSRTKGLGLCSGIGRLGGILGIILGEYKKLHLSPPVRTVIGASTLISAFLIRILPDLTQQKLPKNIRQIEEVQFRTPTEENLREWFLFLLFCQNCRCQKLCLLILPRNRTWIWKMNCPAQFSKLTRCGEKD